MATSQTKRKSAHTKSAANSRKRQKVADTATQNGDSGARRNVRLDSLTWKKVEMPDVLDDWEGLYGLEEIDDVEIVRDAASGKVTCQMKGGDVDSEDCPEAAVESDGGDFEGFSDDDDPQKAAKANGVPQITKPSKEVPKSKTNKKPANEDQPGKSGTTSSTSAPFADIQDDATDTQVDMDAWLSLRLSPDTMAGISRLGFATPTAIQSLAIPQILDGHDVIGKASTGSGKTLAFGIPIFEAFLDSQHQPSKSEKTPIALIVSPTRELAHQLSAHLMELCKGLPSSPPRIATLTGGLSLQKQQRLLKTADIVIGTPGRIWEVMSTGPGTAKAIKQIQFLVLDEADRLLSQGHFKELEEILDALDREVVEEANDSEADDSHKKSQKTSRQTLVFSATFDKGLQQKLAGKGRPAPSSGSKDSMEYLLSRLNFREEKPKFVDANPKKQMAAGLKEGLIECAALDKDLFLYSLLLLHPSSRTLVFVNSVSAVRRLVPFLQNLNLPALALHSQMPQKARLRSIERFSATAQKPGNGKPSTQGSILIATDVAARGLDIPNVQVVVHYHLPRAADMYVHRSGSTARAGETGSSILICSPEEVAGVRRLVAKVHAHAAVASDLSRSAAAREGYFIRSLDIDRRVVSRLKPRAQLAKQLADVTSAKEKNKSNDDVFRQAAEDLGVEYDSEELESQGAGKRGRGAGRKKKEREARELTKDEFKSIRAELNQLLQQRVNVGVSERYPTAGNLDMDALLREAETGGKSEFLGAVGDLGMDD